MYIAMHMYTYVYIYIYIGTPVIDHDWAAYMGDDYWTTYSLITDLDMVSHGYFSH